MKFKYYAVYGIPKDFSDITPQEAMDKFGKVLKKYNMKLVCWGWSFGTSEHFMYVMEGTMDDYQSCFGNQDYADANPIGEGQRTNMILVP